jgi:hypothetical protein
MFIIAEIKFSREDVAGFEVKEEITQKEYVETIKPGFEKARSDRTKLRFLFYFGPEFKGFTSGAVWEDLGSL